MKWEKVKNKSVNIQLPDKVMNTIFILIWLILGSLLFVLNIEMVAFTENNNIAPFFNFFFSFEFVIAYLTMVLIFSGLLVLSGNLFVGFCIIEILSLIAGLINRTMYVSRKQFLHISDLKLINEVTGVETGIENMIDKVFLGLAAIGLIAMVILFFTYQKKKYKTKVKLKKRIIGLLIIILIYIAMFFAYFKIKMPSVFVREINLYSTTGSIIWFNYGIFNDNNLEVSDSEVQSIYEKYVNKYNDFDKTEENDKDKELPDNVIVIMSEAFWDINHIQDELILSKNPMDRYYQLAKDGMSGEVCVNIYGGGTATSEFEFLTGLNAKYLSEVYDFYYVMYSKKQYSFNSYMKELGYYTIAMHPYEGGFWDRNVAYKNMGFDEIVFEEEFINKEKYHGYISDISLTKEIINRIEKARENDKERPVFTFAVSVQNHVCDLDKRDATSAQKDVYDTEVSTKNIELTDVNKKDLEEYINGISQSITGLEELVEYYKDNDEKTVIVFYGDHSPSLVNDFYKDKSNSQLYKTPYLIWSNYMNDKENEMNCKNINISYLSTVLIDYLSMPMTKQTCLNTYAMQCYPVNTRYEIVKKKEKTEILKEIQKVTTFAYESFEKKENALDFWSIIR